MQLTKHVKLAAILIAPGCGLLVCLVLFHNLIWGNQSPADAKPLIGLVCRQHVYDFGRITKAEAAHCECRFRLNNISSHPIRILRQSSSCACTAVDITNEAIPPRESVDVLVKAKFGSRPGKHHETVLLHTNAPQTPTVLLTLEAFVDAPAELAPKLINFGTLKLRERKTRIITISAVSNQELFRLVKVTNPSPNVNITRLPLDGSTNTALPLRGGNGKFAVAITSPHMPGNERTTVTFHTNVDEAKELKLTILAQFQGSIKAAPSIVVFPSTKSPDAEIRRVQITSTQGNVEPQFELLSQSTELNPFHISQIESVPGTEQMTKIVKVALQRSKLKGEVSRAILKVIVGPDLLEVPIVALARQRKSSKESFGL